MDMGDILGISGRKLGKSGDLRIKQENQRGWLILINTVEKS
jgi:hypothetical protein